jgi:hypothetical protein
MMNGLSKQNVEREKQRDELAICKVATATYLQGLTDSSSSQLPNHLKQDQN